MTEEEPKHPYVTPTNAKVHLIFSIIVMVLSVVQLILAIVASEIIVSIPNEVSRNYRYYYLDDLFWTNGTWPAILGFVLAALGYSVYRTKSRSNGIVTSVMLHISCWVAYPTAMCLNAVLVLDDNYKGINGVRYATAAFQGITLIVVMVYAFYSSLHTCCNSHVRKENRMLVNNQNVTVQQPQMIQGHGAPQQVILLPAGQSPMATYYVPQGMGGAHQVAYIQQPPAYSGPPPVLAQQQVPVQTKPDTDNNNYNQDGNIYS